MRHAIRTTGNRVRLLGREHQRGVGLVEVLISVLILGIGMLGIAAMQATALRYGQSSLETSQAVMQTYSILERIRANAGAAGAYNIAPTCVVPTVTPGNLASADLAEWITDLKNTMGRLDDNTTCGTIAGCPGDCVITVTWDDSRASGDPVPRSIITETAIGVGP